MKKQAVICAIDDYVTLTKLNCAVNDSDEMNVQLRSLGYDVVLLRNEQCTANRLLTTLDSLGRVLEDGDIFVFYFAGHGVVSDDDDYYCMHNANDKRLKSPGSDVISYLTLREVTDAWPKGVRKVFILDACRHRANRAEAQSRDFGKGFNNDPKHDIKPYLKGPKIDPETLGILLSCQTGQGAQELHSNKQGLMVSAFKAIIEELKKLSKPLVLDAELERKLGQGMKRLARQHNLNEQTPMLFPESVDLTLGGGVEDYHDLRTREALAEFEEHLAAGRLDRPYASCCTNVLNHMLALNFDRLQHKALADRLQTALDEREQQDVAASDQQLFKAAEAVDTLESWGRYLEKCKLCLKVEQVKAAIKRIKDEQRSGDVAAQNQLEEQRRRDEENRKAEALREQAERDAAEAERKKKAAEEARLATLAEEEIARRKQAEAEEQARISQVAQRAEEARLKEKQLQEAEACRKREEAEATARREAAAKAEAEAKRQKQEVERHQSDEQAWKDTQKQAAASRDFAEKKRLYQAYANRWTLYREQAQSLAAEQDSKIKKAEAELKQEKEAQRLKAEQAERAARETAEREAAEKAEMERRKTAEAAQPAGAAAEPKSGIPGWAWGLGLAVLGVLASISMFNDEKPAPLPPAQVSAFTDAQSVQNSWAALPYGSPDRGRQLERLLELAKQLSPDEKNKLLASMGKRYQNSIRPKDGTAAQSWLNETEKLASAGIKSARFALGSAILSGKNPDTRRAGSLYSQALQGVTAQTWNEDQEMTDAILKAVGKIALIADDRAFAEAINPGLTQFALLGAPDAAFLLANLMVCRANPPRLDDARNYLNIAAKSSAWNKAALARLETVEDVELCDTFTKQR